MSQLNRYSSLDFHHRFSSRLLKYREIQIHTQNYHHIMSTEEAIEQTKTSLLQTANELSTSPFPALLLGSSLLYKGLLSSPPISLPSGTSGSSLKFGRTAAIAKPTRASCYLFGGANLLGAWLMYDGEPTNGAGFNFAWSTLYLIVNGTAGVKGLFRGRISPVALSALALGNAGIYGRKFLWPGA